MENAYSMDNLLEFLDHAANRGLIPATTAQALAVACRSVLAILTEDEKADLSRLDIEAVNKRFANRRAKDFNPASLREYGRRVKRAVDLFLRWREDPANFTIKTRATGNSRKKQGASENGGPAGQEVRVDTIPAQLAGPYPSSGTYQSSFPVRPGLVVTLHNVPNDLTGAEADRLASFIRMLAVR